MSGIVGRRRSLVDFFIEVRYRELSFLVPLEKYENVEFIVGFILLFSFFYIKSLILLSFLSSFIVWISFALSFFSNIGYLVLISSQAKLSISFLFCSFRNCSYLEHCFSSIYELLVKLFAERTNPPCFWFAKLVADWLAVSDLEPSIFFFISSIWLSIALSMYSTFCSELSILLSCLMSIPNYLVMISS